MRTIRRIELPMIEFEPLQAEARTQGYRFVDTTAEEWASGVNRFDGPGELLCGYMDGEGLIAIGGLTADPFVAEPGIGRLRRVYVREAWRNRGIGTSIVTFLVNEARKSFRTVRLRAENGDAARLYESLGFVPIADSEATHAFSVYT